jgi:hypothetical protein
MHHQAKPRSPGREDELTQQAVLGLVLAEHPAHLSVGEIVREMGPGDATDAAERAIQDLVGVGLLRCEVESVLPTRAALHFDRLDCGHL